MTNGMPSTKGTWIMAGVVVGFFALVLGFAAFGAQPTPGAPDDARTAATPYTAETVDSDEEAEEPEPTEEASVRYAEPEREEPAEPDNALGLAPDVITQLGRAADLYNYGLGPGTSLDHDQATNFAYAVSTTCDEWRSGTSTVEDAVLEAVMDGASVEDAEGMNRYLKQVFCPEYYAAGN